MGIGNFERDTRPNSTASDHRYAVNLSPDWAVWGPNGGYVAAITLRAMCKSAALPRPAAFHCQFLKAGRFDAAEVVVERVRAGKRSEALRAKLVQDGEELVSASLWLTEDGMPGLEHEAAEAPDVRKPAHLKSFAEIFDNYADWYPYWRSVEARPSLPDLPTGPPIWQTWMRLNDPPAQFDQALAAARIVLWMDLGPWNAAAAPHPWPRRYLGPNLDLHVQFHRFAETDEWLLVDAAAPVARDGVIGTTLRLWSEGGELVASGGSMLFCRRNPNYEEELKRAQS
ncbi:MAG: thioesterase family protein [Phycisphaerales bacterium]|nr:thioesterase family protein [Hyphomonadaceae bacterium]